MSLSIRFAPALAAAAALALPACKAVDFTAPTGTTLQISANPTEIAVTNGTSTITVSALEASGIPVPDGTHITFTTTLGTVTPDVETRGGIARAVLASTGTAGKATVSAFSGAAKAVTTDVTIGVATSGIALTATPASLAAGGGTVSISATVYGTNSSPVAGARVTFSSTQGSLASGGAPVTTDFQGRATDTLTTTRTTDVTATVGTTTKTITITVGSSDVQNIILSADTVSLPAGGGTVNLSAVVLGTNGPLSGVAVAWSASAGTLGTAGITITDASGTAGNTLTTTAPSTVTAAAAGKTPATLAISVGASSTTARVAISADRSSIPGMSTPDGDCTTPGPILPINLYAQVTDDTGSPIRDREVLFYVSFADLTSACSRAFGEFCGTGSNTVTALTDASGTATVQFTMTAADLAFCNCLPSGTKCQPLCTSTCSASCTSTEDLFCQVAIAALSGGVDSTNVQIIEYGK